MKGIAAEDIAHSRKQISDVARQFYPSVDYPEADQVFSFSNYSNCFLLFYACHH